jgi:ABC-type Fe3+-hydroxamate transport system substrate-binding protein
MGQHGIGRRILSVFAALLALAGAWSCQRNSVSSPAARPATQSSASIRVASLVPAATDLILGMNAADHLAAISNWDPQIPQLDRLPRVGDYRTIDWEKIAQVKPDAMIVQFAPGKMPPGLEQKAAQLHIRLVNIRIYRLDDIFAAIDQIGEAIGEPAKASAANQALHRDLQQVHDRVKDDPPVRTMLVRTENELGTVGGGNFMDDLLTIAGGKNVIAGGENSFPTIDRERLMVLDPDVVIVLLPGSSPQVIQQSKQFWANLPQVSAVKHDRVYVLTEPYLLLPGMSASKIAARLADILHPRPTTSPATLSVSKGEH